MNSVKILDHINLGLKMILGYQFEVWEAQLHTFGSAISRTGLYNPGFKALQTLCQNYKCETQG